MKFTCRIDALRRFVIPIKIFRKFECSENQNFNILLEHGEICIEKFDDEDFKNIPYIGVIRSLDRLHRLTMPAEITNLLKIKGGDMIDITVKE